MFRIAPLPWTLAACYALPPVLTASELLKPEFSVPLALLLAAWLYTLAGVRRSVREVAGGARSSPVRAGLRDRLILPAAFLLCLAWIFFSGIGGFTLCRWDYEKHNFIFTELLESRLPIVIERGGGAQDFILHYPFSYYILPVRLSQLAQALHLPVALDWLLLAYYSGLTLAALRLMAREAKVSTLSLAAVMIAAGGLDVLGMWLLGVEVETRSFGGVQLPWNLEWWGLPFAPQSLTANLFWAPQHFFAALLGTALVLHLPKSDRPALAVLADLAIVVSAGALWSPYVAVGLTALAACRILVIDRGALLVRVREERPREQISDLLLTFAFAVALAAFVAIFFLAAAPLSMPHFLWSSGRPTDWLVTLLVNYAPFLLALCLVVLTRRPGDVEEREKKRGLLRTFAASLLASALLLTVAHGTYNDWAMRSVLPLWIGLCVAALGFLSMPIGWLPRATLLGVLAISAADSASEIGQSAFGENTCAPYGTFDLEALGEIAPQYQGLPDSILYRLLARGS